MIILDPIDENSIDYEKDKLIDVHQLHEEWVRQPALAMTYVKLSAQAEKERDKVKERIETSKAALTEAKARLELAIRKEPEKYDPPVNKKGEVDTKEGWFAIKVMLEAKKDPDCVKAGEELAQAQADLIEANYKLNVYNGAVKEMGSGRKAALEHEVTLWAQGFFSVPNVPKPAPEGLRRAEAVIHDQVSEQQAVGLQSRRKRSI